MEEDVPVLSGPSREEFELKQKELEATWEELKSTKKELAETKAALNSTKRQLNSASSYNDELRKHIDELSVELHGYRKKSGVCVGTQTDHAETHVFNTPLKVEEKRDVVDQRRGVDESKAKAYEDGERCDQLNGFVYDEKSGLYYNYDTCYYYNPKNSLFYNTGTQMYYYFDELSKTYKEYSDVSCENGSGETSQTEQAIGQEKNALIKETVEDEDKAEESAEPTSIADVLRSTAEAAMNQSGFVYDEATGLYFDHSTGYYYDSENCLYFDSSTGYYYYYNTDTNTYEYHSRTNPIPQVSHRNTNKLGKKTKKDRSLKQSHRKKKRLKKAAEKTETSVCDQYDMNSENQSSPNGHLGDEISSSKLIIEADEKMDVDDKHGCEKIISSKNQEDSTISEMESESDKESGELSDTESESVLSESSSNDDVSETESEYDEDFDVEDRTEEYDREMLQSYPPCIRVIVKESDCLEEGQLFIVTCEGTSLGRETTPQNTIVIPDNNLNPSHAEFTYNDTTNQYYISDSGSVSGTFINDHRLSKSKKRSQPFPVEHDAILQIGGTKLLLHIHPGQDTCDLCEPGQVRAVIKSREAGNNPVVFTSKEDKKKEFRKNLKTIKKKYGLENCAYEDNMKVLNNSNYEDKASTRRKTVGSEHPSISERTSAQPASVHREIPAENMGHKLLKKMGWKEGESLGKDNKGIVDPVQVKFRANQAAGLGSEQALECSIENVQESLKKKKWVQAQQRFNKLQGPSLPDEAR